MNFFYFFTNNAQPFTEVFKLSRQLRVEFQNLKVVESLRSSKGYLLSFDLMRLDGQKLEINRSSDPTLNKKQSLGMNAIRIHALRFFISILIKINKKGACGMHCKHSPTSPKTSPTLPELI